MVHVIIPTILDNIVIWAIGIGNLTLVHNINQTTLKMLLHPNSTNYSILYYKLNSSN
jgi:hypothetical protein